MTFTHALSTNNYGVAKFVVSTSAANGTHTTLASAMAAASSGDTIFLRDSVTENVTLTAGVNIAAWTGGSLNVPSITGTLTMTAAGTCNISGIRLVTNSAALLAVTGTAASIVNLNECYLNCSNNTGITFSSSDSGAQININNCQGNLGTTGIAYFSDSSAGQMNISYSNLNNTGDSTTASTKSAGQLIIRNSHFDNVLNYSSTSTTSGMLYSQFSRSGINTTFLTTSGTGAFTLNHCSVATGTASSISIGAGTSVACRQTILNSSNTNVITGAGTLAGSVITLPGSITMNPTTDSPHYVQLGKYKASGQPAFLAYLPSTVTNVTGTGTAFTLGTTTALTEVFDVGGDFNTNGTFTAPVTGKYVLSGTARVQGMTVCIAVTVDITTSNRSYQVSNGRSASSTNSGASITHLCDMDAADTAVITIASFGEAGDTDDVTGSASVLSGFSGYLAL